MPRHQEAHRSGHSQAQPSSSHPLALWQEEGKEGSMGLRKEVRVRVKRAGGRHDLGHVDFGARRMLGSGERLAGHSLSHP